MLTLFIAFDLCRSACCKGTISRKVLQYYTNKLLQRCTCMRRNLLHWRRNTPSKQSFGGASHLSQTMPAPPPPQKKKKTFVSSERSGATVSLFLLQLSCYLFVCTHHMITFMSLMFAELYFAVVLFIDGLKWINELELEIYSNAHNNKSDSRNAHEPYHIHAVGRIELALRL